MRDVVRPTPGRIHAVYNDHDNMKLATEVVMADTCVETAVSLRMFAVLVMGQYMAEDYTSFNPYMRSLATKLVEE